MLRVFPDSSAAYGEDEVDHRAIIAADVRRFGRLINKEGVLGTRSRRHHHGSGGSRVIRRMLADAHDARLGLCFS